MDFAGGTLLGVENEIGSITIGPGADLTVQTGVSSVVELVAVKQARTEEILSEVEIVIEESAKGLLTVWTTLLSSNDEVTRRLREVASEATAQSKRLGRRMQAVKGAFASHEHFDAGAQGFQPRLAAMESGLAATFLGEECQLPHLSVRYLEECLEIYTMQGERQVLCNVLRQRGCRQGTLEYALLQQIERELVPGEGPNNHSNRVVFDEQAMAAGVALYAAVALEHSGEPHPRAAAR